MGSIDEKDVHEKIGSIEAKEMAGDAMRKPAIMAGFSFLIQLLKKITQKKMIK